MVFFGLTDRVTVTANEVATKLRKEGILVSAVATRRFRLVTHYWIDDAAVERTVAAFAAALA
jgi:acetylornithine/succinyldiaminopimelate/putrescine aminotransferase